MLNCMIFWQIPHALDIYRSVHFVILQNGTTGGLMCWICDIFSRNASGFLQNKCWQTRCRWVSAWKKKCFTAPIFKLPTSRGSWLMLTNGGWWLVTWYWILFSLIYFNVSTLFCFFPSFVLLLEFLLYVLFGFFPDIVAFDPLLRPDHWSLRRGPMITPRRCWIICRWSWFLKSFAANQICTKSIEGDGCFCWWIDLKLSVFSEIFGYSRQYSFK